MNKRAGTTLAWVQLHKYGAYGTSLWRSRRQVSAAYAPVMLGRAGSQLPEASGT